jgi:8-oxo-dGTP pyrophosphatase MutT (NUDIX family)
MGRRRFDQIFLPGKYVFPGGRVERADGLAPSADDLLPNETNLLLSAMKGEASPRRARGLAMAAIRETFEETGLIIGSPVTRKDSAPSAWERFLALGYVPMLSRLSFFARAITPPGRPRRYDTRFFCVEASAIAHRLDTVDGELERLDWFTIPEVRSLDLPGITRVVIEDLVDLIASGPVPGRARCVPFYYQRNGSFERVLLSHATATP